MSVHLITGYAGKEHIKAADQGSFNAAFFGEGEFVMEIGSQCEGSIIDNNTVRIFDGDLLMKGRHIRIDSNTYEDCVIETGTSDANRNDLICMQYKKDMSTGIESSQIVVIKGEEVSGSPVDPSYTDGDILAGDTFNQMPLYRVVIEGVVLKEIVPLFTVIPTYKTLAEQYAEQYEETIEALKADNILDSMEEIQANTQPNQIAGAMAVKELNSNLESTTELSTTANSKSVSGKYSVVGKTVVFNGEVVVNSITTSSAIVNGLPSPMSLAPVRLLRASDATFLDGYINTNGEIVYRSTTSIADGTAFTFCGAYIAK